MSGEFALFEAQKSLAPPPEPVDSTTGVGYLVVAPNSSATAELNGYTVDDPTILTCSRACKDKAKTDTDNNVKTNFSYFIFFLFFNSGIIIQNSYKLVTFVFLQFKSKKVFFELVLILICYNVYKRNYIKKMLKIYLAMLVVAVSLEAQSCTKEQIGEMIMNGVSQKQIDKICKKQVKVKKSNGDTIINIYNQPVNTNTNTSTNTNNNSTSSSRSNDKNKRRGLYAGGYIGTAKANQNNNKIINNYGTQSTLELKDSKYLSGMIGYDLGNDIAIEYEKSSYDNKLRSIMFFGCMRIIKVELMYRHTFCL